METKSFLILSIFQEDIQDDDDGDLSHIKNGCYILGEGSPESLLLERRP
ncbi:MAG: hypothetical protein ACQJCO_00495 [cyanobacterium endosymbiont of Rhopalodia sterrenbergii]